MPDASIIPLLRKIIPTLSGEEEQLFDRLINAFIAQEPSNAVATLAEKIKAAMNELDSKSQNDLRTFLNLAAGQIAREKVDGIHKPMDVRAFAAVSMSFGYDALASMFYKGSLRRADCALLDKISEEARSARCAAIRRNSAYVAPPGLAASGWLRSKILNELLKTEKLNIRPSNFATYIYYENEGDNVRPHVDAPEFSYNVLLLISHKCETSKSSRLILLDDQCRETTVDLEQGDFIVFPASRVFHARTPVCRNETVCILTAGFVENV